MTEPVILHDLYYSIDTQAWLDQRTGAHHPEPSSQLQDFADCDVFDEYCLYLDMAARMQLWCAAHGYTVGDGAVIELDDCLSKPVTIVLAVTTGLPRQALALISVDGASPDVYTDRTTDDGYWRAATTIAIDCNLGHNWTWAGDGYLHTAGGAEVPINSLLGRGGTVISRCRDCTAFDDDITDRMCLCPGFAVYCPACDTRCRLTLPEIGVFEEDR